MTRQEILENHIEKTESELTAFAETFEGSLNDLFLSVVDIMTRNRTLSWYCETYNIPRGTMDAARRRKKGCSLSTIDDMLSTAGLKLKVVKIDENAKP